MAALEEEAARERLARVATRHRAPRPRPWARVGLWLIRVGETLSAHEGSIDRATAIAAAGPRDATEPRPSP